MSEMSKNRFRILRGSMQLQPPVVKDVVMACCTLHNFLRTKTENFVHEELDTPDEQMPPCGLSSIPLNAISHAVRGTGAKYNTAAKVVRDKLAEYFVGQGQVSWQWKHANVRVVQSDARAECD